MVAVSKTGKCIILSAPSGAGKTSIAHRLLEERKTLEFSVSACSRSPRNNETNGKDYYFIGIEEFQQKIAENAFLEWEEVYSDHFYGTLKSEVERIWRKNHAVVFDVDVKGGVSLKKQLGKDALSIFIAPPNVEVLVKRLTHRSTESEEEIRLRTNKAEFELSFAPKFDIVVVNDVFENAVQKVLEQVDKFLTE